MPDNLRLKKTLFSFFCVGYGKYVGQENNEVVYISPCLPIVFQAISSRQHFVGPANGLM